MENGNDISGVTEQELEAIKQSTQETEEINLIGVKITYTTDRACYTRFEEFLLSGRRSVPPFSLGILFCLTAVSAYELYKTQDLAIIGILAFLVVMYLAIQFVRSKKSREKIVGRYFDKDRFYSCNKQICFEQEALSFCAFDDNAEKFFEAVYPYSMMDAIFLTPKDYYFIIGNQALIFPREYATKFCDDAQLLELFKSTGKFIRI